MDVIDICYELSIRTTFTCSRISNSRCTFRYYLGAGDFGLNRLGCRQVHRLVEHKANVNT